MNPTCCVLAVCAFVVQSVAPAMAQTEKAAGTETAAPAAAAPAPLVVDADRPFAGLFHNLFADLRNLPSIDSALTLGLGGAAALGTRKMDLHVTAHASAGGTDQIFAVGGIVAGGYVQAGGAVATYVIGRLTKRPAMAHVGTDLIRAQVLTGVLTHGLKLAIRRQRPSGDGGSSYSFPSGHASGSFATATVLWRHLGWKVGVPATLIAAYGAASRLQQNQHYLSDVAFGAALGVAAGRTVTIGHRGPTMVFTPTVLPGGGALLLTLVDR